MSQFIIQRENVKLEEIGLYLRLIYIEAQPDSLDDMADMICDQFNVNCTARDIEVYEELHVPYEQMSRYYSEENREEI